MEGFREGIAKGGWGERLPPARWQLTQGGYAQGPATISMLLGSPGQEIADPFSVHGTPLKHIPNWVLPLKPLKCWFEGWRFYDWRVWAYGFWIMNYSSCQLSFSSKPGLMKDVVGEGEYGDTNDLDFPRFFCQWGASSSHQQSSNRPLPFTTDWLRGIGRYTNHTTILYITYNVYLCSYAL